MIGTGIAHVGPGAFHRAHQAHYINRLLTHDPRWGIAAISLRSGGTVEALRRQQGRYTLAILDAEKSFHAIAAHNRFFGPREGDAVRELFRDPAIRIVSSTVTEKGYCLAGDGTLDLDHPDIAHDLADPKRPASIVGWLALGFADRKAAGEAPFTPLCCDNMASNGKKLRAAVLDYARKLDQSLADWIGGEVVFPDSMVDSITPATDDRLRALVREQGFDDDIPVSREAYAAWVIEDVLPSGAPDFAAAGVVIASDVGAWERAKLRILNGAHSTLAYLGLLLGHETVADAMDDPELARFVERLIREDIIPSLAPSPLDLGRYAGEILERFRNPAIAHKLSQIAWDGSQKLPYRLLDSIVDARGAGRTIARLAVPIAAWMLFVERQARGGVEIIDPLGPMLAKLGQGSNVVERLLGLRQVFPERLATDPEFNISVKRAAERMRRSGPRSVLNDELADA
ncbi:MAG: mannitol dehydrogenase family protein [Sphingomonas sp.]